MSETSLPSLFMPFHKLGSLYKPINNCIKCIVLLTIVGYFQPLSAQINTFDSEKDYAQTDTTLSLATFLEMVGAFHPIAKQADLLRATAKAELTQARGNFDPKIDADGRTKTFDNKDYYDIGSAELKVPLWLIDVKTGVEYGSGQFVNPELSTPTEGLFYIGAEIPLGRDLFTDERRTAFRKAQLLKDMASAERQKELAKLTKSAVKAYANWSASDSRFKQFGDFLKNAEQRLEFVIILQRNGEYTAIDSLEASLELQQRRVQYQEAFVDREQSRLMLSTFLWSKEGIPLALPVNAEPNKPLSTHPDVITSLLPNYTNWNTELHPEFRKNTLKLRSLKYDLTLAKTRLLPDITFSWTPILQTREGAFDNLQFEPESASKAALSFQMPLFLRKERGKLQQNTVKVKDQEYTLDQLDLTLNREAQSILVALTQMMEMRTAQEGVVRAAEALAEAERKKFSLGESSLFLINKREAYVFESALKLISLNEKILGLFTELLEAQGRLWTNETMDFPVIDE
jgi:outer membrane protein TolC